MGTSLLKDETEIAPLRLKNTCCKTGFYTGCQIFNCKI
jgi:hypothetical protein